MTPEQLRARRREREVVRQVRDRREADARAWSALWHQPPFRQQEADLTAPLVEAMEEALQRQFLGANVPEPSWPERLFGFKGKGET